MSSSLLQYEWRPNILSGNYLTPDYSVEWEDTKQARERITHWLGIVLNQWDKMDIDQPLQDFLTEYWHKPLPELMPEDQDHWSIEDKWRILRKFNDMLAVSREQRVQVNGEKAYSLILGDIRVVNGKVVPNKMYLTDDGFTMFVDPIEDYEGWWRHGDLILGENTTYVNPPMRQFVEFLADPRTISLGAYFQIKEYGLEL